MGMEERASASEEEEVNDDGAVWEDWTEDGSIGERIGGEGEDDAEETEAKCLLCNSTKPSPYLAFEHCKREHGFDFPGLRREAQLGFYDSLRLLNYIRFKVTTKGCWNCGAEYDSEQSLLEHLNEEEHSTLPTCAAWKDDKYLTPFLENDVLLYSFEEDRDEEPEDYDVIDKNAVISELADLDSAAPGTMDEDLKELIEGVKRLTPHDNAATSKGKEISIEELKDETVDRPSGNKKTSKVTFGNVTEKEISSVNRNYFSSYGEFGIHREMLADKVRTEAYQKALLNNPTLLKDSIVLDIGCGTGILSLFAVKAGASKVIAVDGSEKMVYVARQAARDSKYLSDGGEKGMTVVGGMIEELDDKLPLKPHSADIIVSEWMGYCLLYESMLGSVLHARDRWLKPGGAILPDVAEMHMAGFGRGGTSLPFWEDVYGFSMKHIGEELVQRAAEYPIVDVIDKKDIITEACSIRKFDLVTMKAEDVDFNSTFELRPSFPSGSTTWCYGVVVWFDTSFTSRFCKDEPIVLSTSPFSSSTHWVQTIFTFKEPIALSKDDRENASGVVGSEDFPAAYLRGRISIARASKHRSIDVSLETTAISSNHVTRALPVQIFDI